MSRAGWSRGGKTLSILTLWTFLAAAPALAQTPSPEASSEEHFALVMERPKAVEELGSKLATTLEVRDLVTVVEVVGDYDRQLPGGSSNAEPRQEVARQFYDSSGDDYDFLIAFSTFDFDAGPARAFAWVVQNSDQGIGLPLFDNSDLFGSAGRLENFVDMGTLAGHATDPLDPDFEETLTILAHEVMHRWGARVRFERDDGTLSDGLLGLDGSHWSFLLDSRASVMYGNAWRDDGDGTFTSVGTLKFFSPLDLYLAGLYGPEEVPPFFLIEGSSEDPNSLPRLGTSVAGDRLEVTIDDVIAAEGPRVPAAGEAPREFRAAFLLLTRPGDTVSDEMIDGINRVREEFQTRFAALTGGRGLMHVYPPAIAEGEPGSPDAVVGGELRPEAVLDGGLAWLRSRQDTEGFWADTPATRVRDTALAVSTLAALDPIFAGAEAARGWLASQPGASTDSVARLAAALETLGTDASSLRQALAGRVNVDGGWGVAPGYRSDPLDTALAVAALAGDPAWGAAVEGAISYLLASQNADGGWANHTGGASRTPVTAAVLRAFEATGRRDELPAAATAFFAGQQNADGGLGDSPSTVHDTANALEALSGVGALEAIGAGEANAYLGGRQSVDGSWEGSVYSTSLALLAIKRFNFPNLAFAGPAEVVPTNPSDGERVEIAFEVLNDGRLLISGGVLRLYEGDPDTGGVAVGEVALPTLTSGQSARVTLSWDTLGKTGLQTLVAVLDPDAAAIELSELDNRLSFDVEVEPAPAGADLEVNASEIAFTPAQPAELPTSLGIAATVRNLGQTDAADVVVRLYLGDPADGVALEETTLLVPQRSSAVATFTYLLETAGSTPFTVMADADDRVAEADETNNRASATISTSGTVDLAIAAEDVALLGPALLGNDLVFRVGFRNRGTLDSPDAVVRYRVSDGVSTRELGEAALQIDAGSSVEREVSWRVDLLGELEFIAEIDPDDLVPEADEANNTARVAFTSQEVTEADLIVERGSLVFSPDPGREGVALSLSVTLRNGGGTAVSDAEVGFYEGDPAQGGTLLGTATVASLDPGASVEAVFSWPEVPTAADRLIFAVADPNGVVAEFDEENNSTFELLEVASRPDPAISAASLELAPRFPRPGESVTLTVRVSNLGEQEVSGLVVRAFDDGAAVAGDQTIALLPAQGEATASFTWTVGSAAGEARSVRAVLDPEGALAESSESNNEASIALTVQDGDFFLTQRYVSPNGDGVQDDTRLFFRLPAPRSVAVEVVDSVRGEVVRREELGTVEAGDFLWDGRDGSGRLVRDADYALRLVDGSGAVLDRAAVTLDTDRLSLLRAAGTGFEAFTNLTCDLPSVSEPIASADGQWLYFTVTVAGDPVYPKGVYRVRSDGSDLTQIVPPTFFGNFVPSSLEVSPDGSKIVFYRILDFPFVRELWVGDGDGSNLFQMVNPSWSGRSEFWIGFDETAEGLLVESYPGGRMYLRSVDGSAPGRLLLQADFGNAETSPDSRFVVYRDFGTYPESHRILEVATGAVTDLPVAHDYDSAFSFSPDGEKLAMGDLDRGRVVVVGTDGEILESFSFPDDPPPDFFGGDFDDGIVPDVFGEPSWSRSGNEFAVLGEYGECERYARVQRFDLRSGEAETVAFTEPGGFGCESYHVSTWDGASWVERGEVHLGLSYREARIELGSYLPDADGEYKVRIRQRGHEAAHVEAVRLVAYRERYEPGAAFVVGRGDALAEVRAFDGEVVDLHGKTLEVRFDGVPPEGGATLVLVAREESLSERDARPFRYPAVEGSSVSVLAGAGAAMVVDGRQTANDLLSEPLFRQWSDPDTGHPAAEVSGYASSDGQHLYAALDFTVDNTLDDTADWAELQVRTAAGWREFRVGAADATWGRVGFERTGGVHHRHKYYEFKVPLEELGIEAGEAIELRFEAYGTAAFLPGSGFLPYPGEVLWDPNDRAILYASSGYGDPSYGIFFDEVGSDGEYRQAPIFDSWNSFATARFSRNGGLLFFESADARNDPQSPCYLRGLSDHWAFRSLLNLTADLRPRRSSTLSGILVEGTAADLHFDRWELDYAPVEENGLWRPIVPPSGQPLVDGRFTTWVPPGPGSYLVRLTAHDLAGNVRQSLRRVVSSDSPSITDLSLTPRIFSPNGDGVLDEASVHYRVLQPVHLDFRFFNADGVRVRTLSRDHAQVGAEFDLIWDGRDDLGLPLPDGDYRMVVQNYEFTIALDSTPPVVRNFLEVAGQCSSDGFVTVAPRLRFAVWDRNFDTLTAETGEGAEPFAWIEEPISYAPPAEVPVPDFSDPSLGDPDVVGTKSPSLDAFVGWNFRLEAVDLAGNRASETSGLGAEELIIESFGRLKIDPATGGLAPIPPFPCGGGNFILELGEARFAVAETIVPELLELYVEIQGVPVVNGSPRLDLLDPAGWFARSITAFDRPGSPIPAEVFRFDWDMGGVAPGESTAIRLRAVDAGGREHLSRLFTVESDGISFNGVLGAAPADPEAAAVVGDLLRALPEDEQDFLKLWGQEFVREDLVEVTLFLSSEEDPRYAVPRAIPASAVVDGGFLFTAEDWRACLAYEGFVVAKTEPAIDPISGQIGSRTLTTGRAGFRFPCIGVGVEIDELTIGACGEPASSTVRTITTRPSALDGRPLQLLTVEGPDETGEREILFSVNNPTSEREYSFEIDTADLPEGLYPLRVRLSNVDGQEYVVEGDVAEGDVELSAGRLIPPLLVVDRTPPARLEIFYPADGQRLCGVEREGRSVVEIEGIFDDDVGGVWAVDVGEGTNPSEWQRLAGPLGVDASGGPSGVSFFGPGDASGVLGALAERAGDFSIRLRAAGNGGEQVCTEPVVFNFDGRFEDAAASLDPELISPDGDGVFDTATVSLSTAEAGTADATVTPAVFDPVAGICVASGAPLRTLASALPLFDTAELAWDGRDDGGSTVADGWYEIAVDFRDTCGNTTRIPLCLEVDLSPPALEILYPEATSPLTQIVEVVGSVSDPHLQGWSVDFGVGADPQTWARIAEGSKARSADVLGVWNTFGLSGEHTLRLYALDTLGNAAEVRVPIVLADAFELLQYLELAPSPFSPNGDGRREELRLRLGLGSEARLDVGVEGEAGNAVRTLRSDELFPAGAATIAWDGRDDGGQLAPDGHYRLVVTARLASNPLVAQEEAVSAVLDATPPALAFDRPAADAFVPSEGAILGTILDPNLAEWIASFTAEPQAPAWVELRRGSVERSEYPLGSLVDFPAGDHGLRLEATDEAENRAELVIAFAVDDTPPAVTLGEPAAGAILGAEPAVVLGAIEEENPAAWVLEAGAGENPGSWLELATGTAAPAAEPIALWNVAALADGPYTLRLTATDRAGLSASAQVLVKVDTTAPEVEIATPAPGGFVGEPLAVVGTAADPNLVSYRLGLAQGPAETAGPFTELGGGSAEVVGGPLYEWLALPGDGLYTLRLTATDAAGNRSSALAEVRVDTSPPAAPAGLVATAAGSDGAELTWQANGEADLLGYHVERDGGRLTPEPLTAAMFSDLGLEDGQYTYTVIAVDRAGLESEPSAPASLRIDTEPPVAAIARPAAGERVSGLVDVVGTAASADDFVEYRLWAEPTAGGGAQLLRSSPVPTYSDLLGQWDTTVLAEGAAYTLRLEAEDLGGNVATARLEVIVDNAPPAAPTGLSAAVSSNDVDLTWNANGEADLAGYLLYRDGRVVNAPGAVIGSLDPYVLGTTSYDDVDVADGTYRYELYAIDGAGNLSAPSAPVEARVDVRAPQAVIAEPEDGAVFEADLYLLATSEDSDVDRVLFQVRATGTSAWSDLAPPVENPPWETDWNPAAAGLGYGDYELRAVATDFGGRTDTSPAAITVTYTDLTRPAPVEALDARVDGGEVTLEWPANTTDADLEGYHVERRSGNGSSLRLTPAPIAAATFTDTGLADGDYTYTVVAVDEVGNESEPSPEAGAWVYTPRLVQPYTPTSAASVDVAGSSTPGGVTVTAELTNALGTASVAPMVSSAEGDFAFVGIALAEGANTLTIEAVDAAGNSSKPASVRVVAGTAPTVPTGLAAALGAGFDVELSWNSNPESDLFAYRLLRDGEPLPPAEPMADLVANASSEAGSYAVAANVLDGDPNSCWQKYFREEYRDAWLELSWPERRFVERVEVDWRFFTYSDGRVVANNPGEWSIEVWDGELWVPISTATGDEPIGAVITLSPAYLTDRVRLALRDGADYFCLSEMRVAHLPLAPAPAFTDSVSDGRYAYQVAAIDGQGFESAFTAPVEIEVGDVVPPEPVVLSAAVSGSDVELAWSASTAPDLARYELYREGERIAQILDPAVLSHLDAGLANGSYGYTVLAVDAVGNRSAPSNEVVVSVAAEPPPAPVELTVAAVATGGALELTWSPGAGPAPAGYRIERSTAGGAWAVIATTPDTQFLDAGLTDSVTYSYLVFALDALGNLSAPSNEASGSPGDEAPPAPPSFYHPGASGATTIVDTSVVTLVGEAEPGSAVSVRRDGAEIAGVTATVTEERLRAELVMEDGYPQLSPDGRWLWFDDFGSYELWDFETGVGKPITDLTGAVLPRWLADSSGLAFISQDRTELRRYDLDGTIETLLSADFVVVALPSPDGGRFVVLGRSGGVEGLWLADPAAETWELLIESPTWQFDSGTFAFSGDGRYFAFQRFVGGDPPIEVIDLSDGSLRQAVPSAWRSIPSSWAADSERLLYATRSGGVRLWVWDAELGVAEPVTGVLNDLRSAVFSPAGDAVIYALYREGIFRQSLEGGEPEPIAGEGDGSFFEIFSGSRRGHLLYSIDFDNFYRVSPAGRFELANVTLAAGENRFSAVATDGASNASGESEPMTLVYELSGRPDLVLADLLVFPAVPEIGGTARITATVRNAALAPAPPSSLSLLLVRPDGGVEFLGESRLETLGPGASTAVSADAVFTGGAGLYRVIATADAGGEIAERSETNNSTERSFGVAVDGEPLLTVETARPDVLADQDLAAAITLYNLGGEIDGTIEIAVEDAAGFEVVRLEDEPVVALAFGASLAVERVWNSSGVFAGSYRVAARLFDTSRALVTEAFAPFEVLEAARFTASVVSDRSTYPPGANVGLVASVSYVEGNAIVGDAQARVVLSDGAGGQMAEWIEPFGDLLPGASAALPIDWPSAGAAAGAYDIGFEVLRAGEVVASASTSFLLSEGGVALDGELAAAETAVAVGSPLELDYTVNNTGAQDLGAVPVRVSLRDGATGAVLATRQTSVDLPVGTSVSGSVSFDTASPGQFLAVLEAELTDGSAAQVAVTLDALSVSAFDGDAPAVRVLEPTAGEVVGADPTVAIEARDDLSPIERVEISVDAGPWTTASLANPATGRYEAELSGLAEGEHWIEARAVDTAGNEASAEAVTFTLRLAPELRVTKVDQLVADLDGDGFASPGDTLGYTIEVRSVGEGALSAVRLDDLPPTELVVVAGSVAADTGTVLSESPVAVDLGTLEPGAVARVSFQAALGFTDLPEIQNQAVVTSAELPPVLSDDPEELGDADPTRTPVTNTNPLALTIADLEIAEGDGEARGEPVVAVVELGLTIPSESDVTLAYATADGTALAGEDYEAAAGTLTIPAGETLAALEVRILGDIRIEGDETFRVLLSEVVGASVTDAEAVVTIVDDEDCAGPDLLENSGAEILAAEGGIPGWVEAEGEDWRARFENPPAHEGEAYFFAGAAETAELRQDVDVSAFAAPIDRGEQGFYFRVWVRTFDEIPADAARVVVEYRDGENVLTAFDSGEISHPGDWLEISDLRSAPVGTRAVRVRLLSRRYAAEGDADGYFDGLALVPIGTQVLTLEDAVVVEPGSGESVEAIFWGRLSCTDDEPVHLVYSTTDGSATAGDDYEPVTAETAILDPGVEELEIAVVVYGDEETEGDEHFFLDLDEVLGALPIKTRAAGLIAAPFCPRGPGYWKNHPEDWPADELMLGDVLYDAEGLQDLLDYGGPDMASKLARQLVTTEFNLLSGSRDGILPTAEAAHEFLAEHPPGSKPRGQDKRIAEELKDELEAYNDAECEDDDDDDDDDDDGDDDGDDDDGDDDDDD